MAISFVGSVTATSSSFSIPAHQQGDLILVVATNPFSSTAPSAQFGYGWTLLATSSYGYATAVYYKFATATYSYATYSGFFSNASMILALVYRGVDPSNAATAIKYAVGYNYSNRVTYPAIYSLAGAGYARGDIALRIAFHRTASNLNTALTGLTDRAYLSYYGGLVAKEQPITSAMGTTLPSLDQTVNSFNYYNSLSVVLPGLLAPAALTSPAASASFSLTGSAVSFSYTRTASAPTASYSVTGSEASFSISGNSLPAVRRRYDVTINDAELVFTRRLFADTGAIALTGSSVRTDYTFALLTEPGGFAAELNGDVQRHLILRATTRSFQLTRGSAILPKGYIVFAVAQTYGVSAASADLFHAAFIGAVSSDYAFDASPDNVFQRQLLFSPSTGAFLETLPEVGVTNNPDGIRPAGMAPRPPAQAQGGSEPSYPSFIRPQYVRFNSVVKAHDLGLLNNIFVNFAGKVGSQVGANTVFFKLATTGPADLRITKNPINRFTDGYISVGILDAERKPVQLTANGFGFRNDIVNTPANEYEEYLPGGVYYFTVSSSQWQALDFDITIQVIRFRELSGRAEVSMTPYGRLPFAKMRGVADLTAPFTAIIPADHIVKRFTGTSQLSSTGRGTITIMQGTVTLAMVPRGRLLTNHKLNGVATMNCAPVATLSSAPPYGGGYGY